MVDVQDPVTVLGVNQSFAFFRQGYDLAETKNNKQNRAWTPLHACSVSRSSWVQYLSVAYIRTRVYCALVASLLSL